MMGPSRIRRYLSALIAALCACATPGNSSRPPDRTAQLAVRDATDLIAEALRSHRLVLLSEHHWSVPVHEQLRRIVADPKVASLIDDIVIEFGNPLYQSIIDRYVAGGTVPMDSVRLAWRNTTQLLAWDSPLYERFYQSVRALNASRLPDRRIRLLAGDTPIDWSRTTRAQDIPRTYGFRDIETIAIIEREVLGKGRRALVIIGEEHVVRTTDRAPGAPAKPIERQSLGEALHHKHPGTAFLVAAVAGDASRLGRAIRHWPNGSMARITGTPLGLAAASIRARDTTSAGTLAPAAPGEHRLQDLFDAVLYAGPSAQTLEPPGSLYRGEPEYEREIRRRIQILRVFYGVDIWSEDLDRLLRGG
jgi:hypothetical protein